MSKGRGGKIKNWILIHESSKEKAWHHEDKPVGVQIQKGRKGWILMNEKPKNGEYKTLSYQKLGGPFNTKAKARKKAAKWMRKHPNPSTTPT